MAKFKVKQKFKPNLHEFQMSPNIRFEMSGARLVIKSMEEDGKEYNFMLWEDETNDLRKFLNENQ